MEVCAADQLGLWPGIDLAVALYPSIVSPVGNEPEWVTVSTRSLPDAKQHLQCGTTYKISRPFSLLRGWVRPNPRQTGCG